MDLFSKAPPVELDPAYVAPEAEIEVSPRQPRVGEWVNGFKPVPNGDNGVRRGLDMFLARVKEVRAGDYQTGGCVVEIWSRESRTFTEEVFSPWCCIVSRTAVNFYSLTGEWPASWPVAA